MVSADVPRLSREEREAAYIKARERIFGKEESTGEATPGTGNKTPLQNRTLLIHATDTEDGNEMSRSSSVSTKDRVSQGKRPKPPKQRRDDSESFDKRSQYTPFYPQPQGPTWVSQPQFNPMNPQQFNGAIQSAYTNAMPTQFVQPAQQFNSGMIGNSTMQPYGNMQQVRCSYPFAV